VQRVVAAASACGLPGSAPVNRATASGARVGAEGCVGDGCHEVVPSSSGSVVGVVVVRVGRRGAGAGRIGLLGGNVSTAPPCGPAIHASSSWAPCWSTGLPRWLCVQRVILTELERVEREDGASVFRVGGHPRGESARGPGRRSPDRLAAAPPRRVFQRGRAPKVMSVDSVNPGDDVTSPRFRSM